MQRFLKPTLVAIIFSLAAYAIYRELDTFELDDVVSAIKHIKSHQILIAAIFTAVSYIILAFYDYSGLKLLKKPISLARVFFESFCSYALSHNLGFPMLTGGAVRMRLLGSWGITASDVANVVAYNSLFIWSGFSFLLGLSIWMGPHLPYVPKHIAHLLRPCFWILIFIPTVLPLILHIKKYKEISLKGFTIHLPSSGLMAFGTILAVLDWFFASMVLYYLLPQGTHLTMATFLKIFLFSQAIGIISHIPGGVGVFEGSMIGLLKPYFSSAPLLGALLMYRIIYYVIPLFLASTLLAAYEVRHQKEKILQAGKLITRPVIALSPMFLTIQVAAAGILLIISGAIPPNEERFSIISDLFPLAAIEFSHFISGLIGVFLLILARGLHRRVKIAYQVSLVTLIIAIILSLVKGFDIDEAIFLFIVLATVYPARDQFYRNSKLLDNFGEPEWWTFLLSILIGIGGILFFCFKSIDYTQALWWQLTADAHVSRSLRATLGVSIGLLALGLYKLFSPFIGLKSGYESSPLKEEINSIINKSEWTNASLALLGDKKFLLNESRDGFVMYAFENRTMVALGDPISDEAAGAELIWSFTELAHSAGAYCVFYEVKEQYLWAYIEAGLSILKLGEEAIVKLDTFKIEGKKRATLRHQRNRCLRDGLSFEVISKEDAFHLMPEFQRISDLWLAQKNTREKGFSLGFFSIDYLRNFPFAIVKKNDRIVGFANILATDGMQELSLDLMRYEPEAAGGIMDFLFTELMLWGKSEGYKTFNLGMAPFAGFEHRPSISIWHRLGDLVFRRGERMYNFRGLRAFKDKYDPDWYSRYLVYPGGFSLPFVLRDVATLISGGVKGVFTK